MISAIILAGGRGKRMGSSISKQFIEIKGKPILYYTIKFKFTLFTIWNITILCKL